MPVLVYVESSEGRLKKSAFETVTHGNEIAKKLGDKVTVISIGNVLASELSALGKYGAHKILNVSTDRLHTFLAQPYASVIAEAAKSENAEVIILPHSFNGKSVAPRVAVKLNAGLVSGSIGITSVDNDFVVRKNAFSGKAFADIKINSKIKIISLTANSVKIKEDPAEGNIVDFTPAFNDLDFTVKILETVKASGTISLPEAEIVVSGGRGLKGPENWGLVEELAKELGAATACSKPVSDAGWRPHSEHVGQTGISISPNLYIAIGISGAIQHLAGVSSSKVIVAINKDPEAPFFKAADYGIVGDAFEVVPKLITAVRTFKSHHS